MSARCRSCGRLHSTGILCRIVHAGDVFFIELAHEYLCAACRTWAAQKMNAKPKARYFLEVVGP